MSEFKVGDKVKFTQSARKFFTELSDDKTHTIESFPVLSYVAQLEDGKRWHTDNLELVEPPKPPEPRDHRAETIAFIQGKLDKILKDQAEAQKEETAARARKEKLAYDAIELRDQIAALTPKAAEKKFPAAGDRVRIINAGSNFFGQYGTVDKVEDWDGPNVKIDGKSNSMWFAYREVDFA